MMTAATEILIDSVGRIRDVATRAATGLGEHQLTARVDPEANTIGWLLWHIGRVQDAQVAEIAGRTEVWTDDGWEQRFGLPFDSTETGYAQSADEVAQVKGVDVGLLVGYVDAVCSRTEDYLSTLTDPDLDAIVDERWDPPVTRGARLVSVISDDLQHAGQAAFIRGLLSRQK